MRILTRSLAATAALFLIAAQSPAPVPSPTPPYTYADLAELALAAPVALIGTVRDAIPLAPAQAPGLRPGHVRLFIEADANRLIRGPQGLPTRISYLADAPLDARGRPPKLRKTQVLILARPLPDRPGVLQLVAPDAQLPLTPETEERVRAILTEALSADAPPRVTGVSGAFHVPGSIPGESETQIFLTTADRRPISLTVLRRPGETPQWAVALGEVVDEAARPPARDTLLWYRLACGLPRTLPDRVLAEMEPGTAQAAAADYALVLSGLGRCDRTRPAAVTRS